MGALWCLASLHQSDLCARIRVRFSERISILPTTKRVELAAQDFHVALPTLSLSADCYDFDRI